MEDITDWLFGDGIPKPFGLGAVFFTTLDVREMGI